MTKQVVGESKIWDYHKSGVANQSGISPATFRDKHAWRNMVNVKGVSNMESMEATCQTSLSAHIRFQETVFVSKSNRTLAFLKSNNALAVAAFAPQKSFKAESAS